MLDSLGLPKAGAADHGTASEAAHAAPRADHATGVAALPDAATKVLDSLGLPKAGAADHGTAGEAAHAAPGAEQRPHGVAALPDAATKVTDSLGLPKPGLPITARPARRRMQRPALSMPPASPRCPMRRPRCWTAWTCPRPGRLDHGTAGEAAHAAPGADHATGVAALPDAATKVLDSLGLPKAGAADHGMTGEAAHAAPGADHAAGVAALPDAATKVLDSLGPKAGADHGTAGEAAPAASGAEHATDVAALPDAATKVLDSWTAEGRGG